MSLLTNSAAFQRYVDSQADLKRDPEEFIRGALTAVALSGDVPGAVVEQRWSEESKKRTPEFVAAVLAVLGPYAHVLSARLDEDNSGCDTFLLEGHVGVVKLFCTIDAIRLDDRRCDRISATVLGYGSYEETRAQVQSVVDAMRPFKRRRREDPSGDVHVIKKADYGSGYSTVKLGTLNHPMIRSNYTPDVLESYDYIRKSFRSSKPKGRFILIEGPPGTGKSHLLRSLITEQPMHYVLVPVDLVQHLQDPDMVSCLASASEEDNVVLIIEDGKGAIASDSSTGSAAASVPLLLNFGNGIIGDLLGVRVIVTTNAPTFEIDPALMREQRLCRRIHVGPLPYEQAQAVAKREGLDMPADVKEGDAVTLAHLYGAKDEE